MSEMQVFTRGFSDPQRQAEIQALVPKTPLETKRDHIPFAKRGWRRLTEYEAVMLHAQNSMDAVPGSQEVGEYVQKWPGGKANYGIESTALISCNWFYYCDPQKRWFMPYVKDKTGEGRATERFIKAWVENGDAGMMNAGDRKSNRMSTSIAHVWGVSGMHTGDCWVDFSKPVARDFSV